MMGRREYAFTANQLQGEVVDDSQMISLLSYEFQNTSPSNSAAVLPHPRLLQIHDVSILLFIFMRDVLLFHIHMNLQLRSTVFTAEGQSTCLSISPRKIC